MDIVQLLVESGADINPRSDRAKTPLEIARNKGHYEVIRYLQFSLQNKFNPNIRLEEVRGIRKLPELVIEEVAEEEEEDDEGTLDETIHEKKGETDSYIQDLEIYLESLNIKLLKVREEKDREVSLR